MTQENTTRVKTRNVTLPLIPLRGLVVFPYMILHFDVGRKKSVAALEKAMVDNQQILLVAQKNVEIEEPKFDELYKFGTLANIKQLLKLPNGNIRVLVEGIERVKLIEQLSDEKYIVALAKKFTKPKILKDKNTEALVKTLKDQFDKFVGLNPTLNKDSMLSVMSLKNPVELADLIASNSLTEIEDKIAILSENNIEKRLTKLIALMIHECEILEIEQDITAKVKSEMTKEQREYYLREQIKVITEELDGKDGVNAEVTLYKTKIDKLNIEQKYKDKLNTDADRLLKMPPMSSDGAVIRTYLDTILSLPWNIKTKDNYNLKKVEHVLNQDHYGLEKVKERIIEYLSVSKLTENKSGTVLCLVGPPGVGKTSIAKSIAKALGKRYVRMSLGGVKDEAEIRGHRKTYIGAMPGRIISALKQAGSKNAFILFDEIDKMSSNYNGDPASAMLEVLDGEQNNAFTDHYTEIPFDLSDCMFMTTANSLETIPLPLLDRMEIIELSSYTETEKTEIASNFLVPKQRKQNGLNGTQLKINKNAIKLIINYYTREAGVRELERQIATICRKTARLILEENKSSVNVNESNIEELLGRKKFFYDKIYDKDEIGVVNGLAWTSVGGDTLKVEANVMEGTGKVELTGKLGDVMKESAIAAISYLRANSKEYNISDDFYKNKDIHIHVPEGAIPKDGPSAGITMATALYSSLKNVSVKCDVAMTGEITIRGRVLPIGGLKEKAIAANRAGIKTVIIPSLNKNDVLDIPLEIRNQMNFITVDCVEQVFENAISNNETVN